MPVVTKPGRILLLTLLSLFVTGCPSADTARQAFDRGQAHEAQRRYSQALGEYERALRLAGTEGADAFASQIQEKISQVKNQIDEIATEEVRASMRDAERHSQNRNWSQVLSSLERARRALDRIESQRRGQPPREANQLLREQLAIANDSQQVKLARTAQVYARMSREARWSNWQHWLRGDEWFTFWGELNVNQLSSELNRRAAAAGDAQVTAQASQLGQAWDSYWLARVTSRNNDDRARPGANDPAWVHVLSGAADVFVAVNEAHKGVKFDKARQAFESQLDGALGRTQFPRLQLHPAPPAAPAPATPVAAAPIQPAPASATAVTSVTPGGAPTAGSAPTGPVHGEDVVRTP